MRSASCAATSKAPSLTAGGVHQWSRSKGSPFLKKIENWPPSGPSQKRSSPPKAFMCGLLTPEAISSRLIQPKLSPSRPAGRAGHDPALEVGIDRDLGLAVGAREHDDLRVRLEEGQVVPEQDPLGRLGRFRAGRREGDDHECHADAVSHGSLLRYARSPHY